MPPPRPCQAGRQSECASQAHCVPSTVKLTPSSVVSKKSPGCGSDSSASFARSAASTLGSGLGRGAALGGTTAGGTATRGGSGFACFASRSASASAASGLWWAAAHVNTLWVLAPSASPPATRLRLMPPAAAGASMSVIRRLDACNAGAAAAAGASALTGGAGAAARSAMRAARASAARAALPSSPDAHCGAAEAQERWWRAPWVSSIATSDRDDRGVARPSCGTHATHAAA